MSLLRSALLALCGLMAAPASAQDCNPPPPGLDPQSWYGLCEGVLQYWYQQNSFGLDYESFVSSVYAQYVQASMGGGGGGAALAGGQCAGEGQTMCNASGWLLTCSGGIWMTGSTQC